MIEGFDVSSWQDPEKWDWDGLKRRGVQFLVARASYGKGTADRHFKRYAALAHEHEIAFGAYIFYRQIHSVEEQLAVFDRQVDAAGGLLPGDILPVLDMEENSANGDGRPKAQLFGDACLRILDEWREQYGGAIAYYSSYFPEYLKVSGTLDRWNRDFRNGANLRHWLADYDRDPGKPRTPYTNAWALHQPRPRKVPEYARGSQVVDYDVAAGTIDALLIRANPPEVSPDTTEGEIGTTDRPGGADAVRSGAAQIRAGVDLIQRGLAELDRS